MSTSKSDVALREHHVEQRAQLGQAVERADHHRHAARHRVTSSKIAARRAVASGAEKWLTAARRPRAQRDRVRGPSEDASVIAGDVPGRHHAPAPVRRRCRRTSGCAVSATMGRPARR
jgi:CCR4-NOT transcriptional regulation complex NOT5 subunit